MSVLAAERIKLLSTRSPWWTSGSAIVLVVGLTALIAGIARSVAGDGAQDVPASPGAILAQLLQFGLVIVMVMATLSATTEYRFGTIRTTFQAVPKRPVALVGKAVVVATTAAVVGLVSTFLAWVLAAAVLGSPSLLPSTAGEWRLAAGAGAVFALGAVIALAVGILLRQTAGAVTLLLIWVLVAEPLIGVIPRVGDDIARWLPFTNATNFLSGPAAPVVEPGVATALSPLGSLLYLAAFATALFAIAVAVADRRDA